VPYTCLSPLIDKFNHSDWSQTHVDIFHSKLHLADNKIYKHKSNFDRDFEKDDEITDDDKFDMKTSRLQYDVRTFYQIYDQEKLEANGDLLMGHRNKKFDHYDESEVFNRFKLLYEFENSDGPMKIK
jgi:hypothetical protein